jgi:hypothetical protein
MTWDNGSAAYGPTIGGLPPKRLQRQSSKPSQPHPETDQAEPAMVGFFPRQRIRRHSTSGEWNLEKEHFPYISFRTWDFIGGGCLVAMASYPLGKTAHYAPTQSCYHLIGGHSQNLYQALGPEHVLAAKMMHAGSWWDNLLSIWIYPRLYQFRVQSRETRRKR